MPLPPISIDADIRAAHTLPAAFYRDAAYWEAAKAAIFAPAWQYIGGSASMPAPGHVQPLQLLPGLLDEPLLLTHDGGALRCLSNVCTHRANLVAGAAAPCHELRCRYHGRRFGLDGRFKSMPEFQDAADFPAESDHLPTVEMQRWGPLHFVALPPNIPYHDWLAPVRARLPGPATRSDACARRSARRRTGLSKRGSARLAGFLPAIARPCPPASAGGLGAPPV